MKPEMPILRVSPEYKMRQDIYRSERRKREQEIRAGLSGRAFFLTSAEPNFSAIELYASVKDTDEHVDDNTQERRAILKIGDLDDRIFAELEGKVLFGDNDDERGLWIPCDFNNALVQYGKDDPLRIRVGFLRKDDWYPPDITIRPESPIASTPDRDLLLV